MRTAAKFDAITTTLWARCLKEARARRKEAPARMRERIAAAGVSTAGVIFKGAETARKAGR